MKVIIICILLIVLPLLVYCKILRSPGQARGNPIKETTSEQLTQDMLRYHKAIRAYHGLPALEYSDSLKEYARLRALLLAFYEGQSQSLGEYLNLGENVWFQEKETKTNASAAVNGWYYEQSAKWNYASPHLNSDNRNFAQMIWKETTHIGCGQAYSARTNPGTYTICYYFPAGSVAGQEADNVPRPKVSGDPKKLIEEMVKGLVR